jgi:hypothetical protein
MVYSDPAVREALTQTLHMLRELLIVRRDIRDHAAAEGEGRRVVWAVNRMTHVQDQIYRLESELRVDPDE